MYDQGGWGRWHQRAEEVQRLGRAANGGASHRKGSVGQSDRMVGLIVKRRPQQIKTRRRSDWKLTWVRIGREKQDARVDWRVSGDKS